MNPKTFFLLWVAAVSPFGFVLERYFLKCKFTQEQKSATPLHPKKTFELRFFKTVTFSAIRFREMAIPSETGSVCVFCNRSSEIRCQDCGLNFCCRSHEKVHRPDSDEKSGCFPFKIRESEGVGRWVENFDGAASYFWLNLYSFVN